MNNRIAEIEARAETVLDGQPIQTVMLAREIISEDIPYILSALTHAQRERDELKDQLDSGELVRVVHGEWKLISESTGKFEAVIEEECSVCGRNVVRYSTQPKDVFCPNCGAKMDGKPKE